MPSALRIAIGIGILVGLIELAIAAVVFDKLGMHARSALLFVLAGFAGSLVNIPLFNMPTDQRKFDSLPPPVKEALLRGRTPFALKTTIKLNAGGGLVPLLLAIQLLVHFPLRVSQVFVATAIVAAVADLGNRLAPRAALGVPLLLGSLAANLIARMLDPDHVAALAYVSATVGMLVGAELLSLRDVRNLGRRFVAIGGSGTFDAMFVSGLLAAVLA